MSDQVIKPTLGKSNFSTDYQGGTSSNTSYYINFNEIPPAMFHSLYINISPLGHFGTIFF